MASFLVVTEADVRAALAGVIHPSFGLSLVALEMVRAVRVTPSGIEVDLVMDCPGCPAGEAALASARRTLRSLDGRPARLMLLPERWAPPWLQWAGG